MIGPWRTTVIKIDIHYAENRKHNVILSRGISYVLSVCGLRSNLATVEVSCQLKNGRVSHLSKRLVISYTRPPSTTAMT